MTNLFVYPSTYEGFGLPPLEAMCCGAPVVVARSSSLPEVVGERAIFANPYDYLDIARALEQGVNDKSAREKALTGIAEYRKKFSWEKMTERPWVGWGLRSFTPLYKEKTGIWLGHPHNLYLMLGSETGMIGLGLFLVWVGWIMAQGMRLCLTCQEDALILFTYLLAFTGCIFFNTLDVTVLDGKLNVINWIILGAIAGIVFRGKTAL
jgi:hypothetical protein